MDRIKTIAHSMIRNDGQVAYIIDLLEDMNEARMGLLPEIRRIEEVTQGCLTNLQELCKTFEYWYWLICCLKNNAVEVRGIYQGFL